MQGPLVKSCRQPLYGVEEGLGKEDGRDDQEDQRKERKARRRKFVASTQSGIESAVKGMNCNRNDDAPYDCVEEGLEGSLRNNSGLRKGLSMFHGCLTCQAVADAHGLPYETFSFSP